MRFFLLVIFRVCLRYAVFSAPCGHLTSWLSCVLSFLVFSSLFHMYLNPHQVWGWVWFKPSSNFFLTVPMRFFLLVIFRVCLRYAVFSAPCGHLTSWLSCVLCILVFLSLSHMVFQVRYGTWSYRFLIFAFLTTMIKDESVNACEAHSLKHVKNST